MIFSYEATVEIPELGGGRQGVTWDLDTKIGERQLITEFHPPKLNDDFVIADVGDFKAMEVTIRSDGYDMLRVDLGFIDISLEHNYNEFLQSTRKRELFTLDPDGISGHTKTYTVHRVGNGVGLEHYSPMCNGFRLSLNLRALNI